MKKEKDIGDGSAFEKEILISEFMVFLGTWSECV